MSTWLTWVGSCYVRVFFLMQGNPLWEVRCRLGGRSRDLGVHPEVSRREWTNTDAYRLHDSGKLASNPLGMECLSGLEEIVSCPVSPTFGFCTEMLEQSVDGLQLWVRVGRPERGIDPGCCLLWLRCLYAKWEEFWSSVHDWLLIKCGPIYIPSN